MKKITLSIVIIVFLSFVEISFAQTDSATNKSVTRRAIEDLPLNKINQSPNDIKNRGIKEALFKTRITQFLNRLEAGIARAESIASRIFTRFEKINEANGRIRGIIKRRDVLSDDLNEIKAEFTKLKSMAATIEASSSSRQDYLEFRKSSHNILVQLERLFNSERNLLKQMTRYAPKASNPTVTVNPSVNNTL